MKKIKMSTRQRAHFFCGYKSTKNLMLMRFDAAFAKNHRAKVGNGLDRYEKPPLPKGGRATKWRGDSFYEYHPISFVTKER